MKNESFDTLLKDLTALGIRCGDVVIVHSSLSSMGYADGGAETVIFALQQIIGKEGTLLFPAFTYADPTQNFRFKTQRSASARFRKHSEGCRTY